MQFGEYHAPRSQLDFLTSPIFVPGACILFHSSCFSFTRNCHTRSSGLTERRLSAHRETSHPFNSSTVFLPETGIVISSSAPNSPNSDAQNSEPHRLETRALSHDQPMLRPCCHKSSNFVTHLLHQPLAQLVC